MSKLSVVSALTVLAGMTVGIDFKMQVVAGGEEVRETEVCGRLVEGSFTTTMTTRKGRGKVRVSLMPRAVAYMPVNGDVGYMWCDEQSRAKAEHGSIRGSSGPEPMGIAQVRGLTWIRTDPDPG